MSVSHEATAASDEVEDIHSVSTDDLVEVISQNYRKGEPFDAAAVFELANRALDADPSTPPSDGHYEDGMWVESF